MSSKSDISKSSIMMDSQSNNAVMKNRIPPGKNYL